MSSTCVTQSRVKACTLAPIPKMQPVEGWTFVNLSEPKQSKDKSLRKFVRSNVMRNYRQRMKENEIKHPRQDGSTTTRHEVDDLSISPTSTLPTTAQREDGGGYFISCGHTECVYNCRYSPSRICSNPKQLLGNGGIDPFDSSPIRGNGRYNGYVLNHCELPSHSPLEMQPLILQ